MRTIRECLFSKGKDLSVLGGLSITINNKNKNVHDYTFSELGLPPGNDYLICTIAVH